MNRLCLANIDYGRAGWPSAHVTDEGRQLQEGLEEAGWTLAGHGFADGCADVPALIERHRPRIVFVQDKRDWDPGNPGGCYDPAVRFRQHRVLADHPAIVKAAPVKDAGSMKPYQQSFLREIRATAAVVYYHEQSCLAQSPWLADYQLVRTYHSVDSAFCAQLDLTQPRQRGLLSGAVSDVYPMRSIALRNQVELGVAMRGHPGYGNRGCDTPNYLRLLCGYRVHLATASRYGFALRKIIESVACGCTPVTDLPAYDVLPEIDEAIVRIPHVAGDPAAAGGAVRIMKDAIDSAEAAWDLDRAMHFAAKARAFYDWRHIGERLSAKLTALAA